MELFTTTTKKQPRKWKNRAGYSYILIKILRYTRAKYSESKGDSHNESKNHLGIQARFLLLLAEVTPFSFLRGRCIGGSHFTLVYFLFQRLGSL